MNFSISKAPTEIGQAGAHNYGKVCDRELAALTNSGISKIVKSVTKIDSSTGRTVQDTCSMCTAVYDNAKCLTTQNECMSPFFLFFHFFYFLFINVHIFSYFTFQVVRDKLPLSSPPTKTVLIRN